MNDFIEEYEKDINEIRDYAKVTGITGKLKSGELNFVDINNKKILFLKVKAKKNNRFDFVNLTVQLKENYNIDYSILVYSETEGYISDGFDSEPLFLSITELPNIKYVFQDLF